MQKEKTKAEQLAELQKQVDLLTGQIELLKFNKKMAMVAANGGTVRFHWRAKNPLPNLFKQSSDCLNRFFF